MMYFNTEANLKASSLLAGQNVYTRGKDTLLDKGNGEFYIMTLGDYGGTPPGPLSPDLTLANGNVAVRMAVQAFPQGGIVMWSGGEGAIPEGWSLCDGTNGTPDLRDRFVIGTGGTYSTDDIGGKSSINLGTTNGHALTVAEMPAHSHAFQGRNYNMSLDDIGVTVYSRFQPNDVEIPTGTSGSGAPHHHTIAGATGANLPPYYALAFIMRTGSIGAILNPIRPEGKAEYLNVSGVVDLDAKSGAITVFVVKPNANITELNIINLPVSADIAYGAAIKLVSDGASAITFGPQFNWPLNIVPTLSTTPGTYEWFSTFTTDNGVVMDIERSISDLD